MSQAPSQSRVKFATQLAPEVLAQLKEYSQKEGRQMQAVLDEALREYFDKRQQNKPRRHVLAALQESMADFDSLYRELAK